MRENMALRRAPRSRLVVVRWLVLAVLCARGGDDTGGAPPDAACDVGMRCGNDCLASDDACWACGELVYDSACNCRPAASTCVRPDCSNPAPAAEGEHCGTYWWCDRPCAAGLTCRDADDRADLYLMTCQP
jgi:hypothetical protein